MQDRTGTGTGIGWARLLAYGLLALAVGLAPALVTDAFAAPATTYRIIQLSAQPFAGGDIDAKGQVAFNEAGPDGLRVLYYHGRTIRNIGGLGGPSTTAVALNDHGQVTGYSLLTPPSPFQHPFFWSEKTGMIDILGEPDIPSSALDLNNRGQVVGSINDRAYVWSRNEAFVDLNTRVPGAPPDLVLISGVGIAENGSILVSANTGLLLLVPNAASQQPPVAGPLTYSGAARVNQALSFHAAFKDADPGDTHKASWSWGDGAQDAGTVSEKNGSGSVSGQHVYRRAGIYTVVLTITDSSGRSTRVERKVVVCGHGAWVAGEGQFLSAPGASKADPGRSGLASIAFLSGTSERMLSFSVPGLALGQARVESMMVRGNQVQYQGSASLNGKPGYRFTVTASRVAGGEDRVRVRVWHLAKGSAKVVDYDNLQGGAAEGAAFGKGAITVQLN